MRIELRLASLAGTQTAIAADPGLTRVANSQLDGGLAPGMENCTEYKIVKF